MHRCIAPNDACFCKNYTHTFFTVFRQKIGAYNGCALRKGFFSFSGGLSVPYYFL